MKRYIKSSATGGRYYLEGWDVGDFVESHSYPTLDSAVQGANNWCGGACDIVFVPNNLISSYQNAGLSGAEIRQLRRWHGPNFR